MTNARPRPTQTKQSRSLFHWMDVYGALLRARWQHVPSRFLPRLMLLFSMALLYVANTHRYEKMLRQIGELEQEVHVLRTTCTTLQASYMYQSKQSEIAKRVERLNLIEGSSPPLCLCAD